MTYYIEPFIQDTLWLWLKNQPQYTEIGSEVRIGSEINAGRIDIVAKTVDGKYHGFEVKNSAFADEQVNRYLNSGYLDKVFHVSRIGQEVADRLKESEKVNGGVYVTQQIRKQVSNAIAAGQYTEEDYRQRLEEQFPDSVLNQSVLLFQSNEQTLDESEKTIRSRLTKHLGIPTADFEPEETYITLPEAISRMQNNLLLPKELGVIDVPLGVESLDDGDSLSGFQKRLNQPVTQSLSKETWKGVELVREAESLDRDQTPSLSRQNEAWVQHHVWSEFGDIREGVVPSQSDDAEYLIDIMGFSGEKTPAAVYQNECESALIGVEAKGEAAFADGMSAQSIREQLLQYRDSGTLTHLYIAVPDRFSIEGKEVISHSPLEGVGLMTVTDSGTVEIEREADRLKMQYDSYIKISGSYEYPRSIGFGRIRPRNEPDPVAPCYIDSSS